MVIVKQKTAYDMRISDWSADVCSSDLHGSLLLGDSIQAGLRATGTLSVVDYPGFEGQEAPDMETYSKALNAGQYPLSVLALTEHAAGIYQRGTYGNTMTGNPRALDVACAVLDAPTPELRQNILERGEQALAPPGKPTGRPAGRERVGREG